MPFLLLAPTEDGKAAHHLHIIIIACRVENQSKWKNGQGHKDYKGGTARAGPGHILMLRIFLVLVDAASLTGISVGFQFSHGILFIVRRRQETRAFSR